MHESTAAEAASRLCAACGMCCDGTLFQIVRMQPSDRPGRLMELGARIRRKNGESFMEQPCAALRQGGCSIYSERPVRCRAFRCEQLRRLELHARTEAECLSSIRSARALVERVKGLLEECGQRDDGSALVEQYERAIATRPSPHLEPEMTKNRQLLDVAMHDLKSMLNHDFHPRMSHRALALVAPRRFEWVPATPTGSPGAGEVLVRVRAIGICGTDFSGFLGKMPFIEYPRILGHELGVEVLATGEGVTGVKSGDRCAVEPYLNCGSCQACKRGNTNCCETLAVLGVHTDGGMREELLLPAAKLHVGNALAFEQLALVETLAIGCHAVNRASVMVDDEVLIIGAGPIGLTVVEFARAAGARITVLESNARRRAFVETHYAGVRATGALAANYRARVIFDATGNAASMSATLGYAEFTGRIVFVGITKESVVLDDPLFHRRELTLLASRNAQSADFPRILGMIQRGEIDTRPWISHRCDFADLPQHMESWLDPAAGVIKAVTVV
ncbi:MAG: alcohol dehydrogenase catalytic domain-containing protein [Verrucomicrobiaceae bacterium]|nr:alcohol dehydrogenase catalytic domain-containing protein [Verrucomicrobiaceae bacterium]